jgi:hypothetical protein
VLLRTSVELAEEQLAQVQRQAELSKFLFDNAPEYFRQVEESGALDEASFQDRINEIRGNVSTYAENALRLGEADINRQSQLGLESVRDVLAPERGLRPGDSPILGLGSDIVREGQFQQGQLVRAVRGQEALQLANFDQAATEFQANLQQQAFNNRLALAGGASELGIGLNPNFDVTGALSVHQQPRLVQTKIRGKQGNASLTGEYGFGGGAGGGGGTGCWIAAEFYGWHTTEWQNARRWLFERWHGRIARSFRWVYLRHGPRIAGWVRRSRIIRETLRPLFAWAERKGR